MSLDKTKKIMDTSKKVLDSVKNGTYDYETELESYIQAMETAKDSVKSAERTLSKAEMEFISVQNEINRRFEVAANAEAKSHLSLESTKTDVDVKQEEIDKLEAIIESNGIIRAEMGGNIINIGVEEGKITAADSPVVTLSTGGYSFEVILTRKEAERIVINDICNIRLTGSKDNIKAKVDYMENIFDEAKGEQTKIIITLPNVSYVVGMYGEITFEKSSELFDGCISLSAVREDNIGKFVLVVREKDSILGKELVATRVEVTIIDRDSSSAVIESGLTPQDRVINESSKEIKEGDRVRIVNSNL
jgi:biotin carboxyl carrier protein